jgi:hypothetical protein
VAWIFGQGPKRQKHVSACSVTFAKANNLVSRGVLIVRRSDNEMKRNAEVGLITKSSKFGFAYAIQLTFGGLRGIRRW